jgi:acyl-CoA synthetase (AMP-forming)/AMP-acid ligase II
MSALEDMAMQALARGAAYPAVEYEKRWFSWEDVRQAAGQANDLIDASGADPCAPVALLPRNRPAIVSALIGLLARRRHVRMIHVHQSPAGIARAITRLSPAAVVGMSDDLSQEVCMALEQQGISGIALTGLDTAAWVGSQRSTIECDVRVSEPQIDLLTSGTTGPPKQFSLSYALIANHMVGENTLNIDAGDPLKQPPMFIYAPCSTITGLYLLLPALLHGMRGILVDRFTVDAWHDYVVRYRPASVGLPVPALQMILESELPKEDLASLRCVTTGTATVDPTVKREFENRYGIPVLVGYGATEFGGPVTMTTLDLHREWGQKKVGSVGRVWAGAQLRVVHPVSGALLPPGQQGLLEVMAPRMGPQWIRSSDLAVVDEDGFLFIRGRADGAINRGGFKLLPDAIERALKLHDAVSAAAVIGIPDKRLGQVPAAAIQLKPNVVAPTIDQLEKHLRQHVEATHIPTTWRFVDALPYTPTFKVDRAALSALFENRRDHVG